MLMKSILSALLVTTLIACSAMPKEKIKQSFSDAYIGDDTSALLTKLKKQDYYCDDISKTIDGKKYSNIPEDAVFYKCKVETDPPFCLHTGGIIFSAKNGKLIFIEQGVHRTKACIWSH